MLSEEFKQFIRQNAKNCYPNECCGFILDNNIVSCKNISSEPLISFIIDPDEVDKYGINNIKSFYHSHQKFDQFSALDIAFSEKLNKKSILYICDLDIFKEYEPQGITLPYINRPFFIGQFDCFTLTKEYMLRELNIKIEDKEWFNNHEEIKNYKKWGNSEYEKHQNNTIFLDFFVSQGFIEVKDLKKHDIILTKLPGVKFTSHICIYLGENKILHHFSDFSGIMPYSNALKRLTTHILRHSSLM